MKFVLLQLPVSLREGEGGRGRGGVFPAAAVPDRQVIHRNPSRLPMNQPNSQNALKLLMLDNRYGPVRSGLVKVRH